MFLDFLASISFYFVPYLAGRLLSKNIVFAWTAGAIFWTVAVFLLNPAITRYLIIVITFISIINIIFTLKPAKLASKLKDINIILLVGIVSFLSYFLLFKHITPYPFQLNWDIYEHITLSNEILSGNKGILPSQISDTFTFDGYTPAFSALLSIPKILFGVNLLGVYYFLEYWHYFLTILISFFLGRRIFGTNLHGLVTAILAAFVFESTVVYSSVFLIPQTLTAALAAASLIALSGKFDKKWLVVVAVALISFHFAVGLVSAAVVGLYLIYTRTKLLKRFRKYILLLAFIALLASIGLHFLGSWEVTGREEAKYFNFGLLELGNFLLDWYGIGLILPFIWGVLWIIDKDKPGYKAVLIVTLFLAAISFLPFSYVLKFFVLGRYFVNLIVACGIAGMLMTLPVILRWVGLYFLALVLVFVFYTNQFFYKEPLYFKGVQSHVSQSEIEASNWLFRHIGKDTFLVSDPATAYILEALSGVNSQGGAYMDISSRKALESLNFSYNPVLIKSTLGKIQDKLPLERKQRKHTIWVLSARYFAWQKLPKEEKESFFYNIWAPKELKIDDLLYIYTISDMGNFKVLYKNKEMVILQIL